MALGANGQIIAVDMAEAIRLARVRVNPIKIIRFQEPARPRNVTRFDEDALAVCDDNCFLDGVIMQFHKGYIRPSFADCNTLFTDNENRGGC